MEPTHNTIITITKLVLYYFAYQLGFSAVAMGLSHLGVAMDMTMMTSLAMVASTLIMAWHLIHFGYVSLAADRYREVSLSTLGVSIVFIFTAMYVLNLLIEQIGIPNTLEDTFLDMSSNPLGIISMALLAPILEELLFRGAIQGYLIASGSRPWIAIAIASLIFGVVHLNPAQIPFAFLLGMMFGWLYYRTGSLLPGIVGHILNNSIATLGMILYGDTTIEEQMPSDIAIWIWALVALVVFIKTAKWLNRNLPTPSSPHVSDEEQQVPLP